MVIISFENGIMDQRFAHCYIEGILLIGINIENIIKRFVLGHGRKLI